MNKVIRKHYLMKQKIDSIKTLFFPTLKEYIVKNITSRPLEDNRKGNRFRNLNFIFFFYGFNI